MTKPKLDTCKQWWALKLAPFDFDLKYIPGSQHIPADLLSCEPFAKVVRVTKPGNNLILMSPIDLDLD